MLNEVLKKKKLILASASPRRHAFFKDLGLDFEVQLKLVEEVYPAHLQGAEISDYLSKLKAEVFIQDLKKDDILITSDTVVWHQNKSLAKPANSQEAYQMLKTLSGDWHQVITSVCFTTAKNQKIVHDITEVKFKRLSDAELWYYINNYHPFDKAGSYGIQEWIGMVGVEEIKGTYTNVMGLPTQLVYKTLMHMAS